MAVTFRLRPWTLDDLPALVKHANDPSVAENLTDAFPHPYTSEHGKAFLQRFMAQDPPLVLAIDVGGVVGVGCDVVAGDGLLEGGDGGRFEVLR